MASEAILYVDNIQLLLSILFPLRRTQLPKVSLTTTFPPMYYIGPLRLCAIGALNETYTEFCFH